MIRILITGANSYIGTSFETWLLKWENLYCVDVLDMKNDDWIKCDFSVYDVVFHVAGIAHVSTNTELKELYYRVNRDLAVDTAKKAKYEGVKQFIFMSSIIVYGEGSSSKRIINRNTVPNASNFYGDSKIQAEKGIKTLADSDFKVVILRPPMIYGKNSKGNYPKLSKVAYRLPIFPNFENERSMLHIDNLCEFIRLMIDNEECGIFFPQNSQYVKTSEMVRMIAQVHGKKILLVEFFNPLIKLMMKRSRTIKKLFGNLVYEKTMSEYKKDYRVRDLNESIRVTER